MVIRCAHTGMLAIGELKNRFHPKNRNNHPEEQIVRLAKILAYQGIRYPVKISNLSGKVTSGHGRIMAAEKLNWTEFPVDYQDYDSEEQEYADVQADNAIASWAEFDLAGVNGDLESLGPDFDLDMLGIKDFILEPADKAEDKTPMTESFLVPPFTVLDARQGYWQDRKRQWLDVGIESQKGRADNLLSYSSISTMDEKDTSIFDPVLCELAYRWFSPANALVLDPFAGGSVRGIVASLTGRQYFGIDLSQQQVEANQQQAKEICKTNIPEWVCGDSLNLPELFHKEADLICSCPPYFDLEKYSEDPRDLSNMGYGQFLDVYRTIIGKACQKLKDNRFAFWVVGEIRDKQGIYRNFVGDTIWAFEEAGMKYYNEAILVTAVGSLPLRAGRMMKAGRKLGKAHQNVLVFCKGDPKIAAKECGEIEIETTMEDLAI